MESPPAHRNWTRPEVEDLISRFQACRVPRAEWTHEAHLVAGFWYVTMLGPTRALEQLRERISRHNEGVGTPNTDTGGYHESITRLFLGGIDDHITRTAGRSFEEQLASLLDSPMASSGWPLRHYSRERLFSVAARRGWVEPDLAPLPGRDA